MRSTLGQTGCTPAERSDAPGVSGPGRRGLLRAFAALLVVASVGIVGAVGWREPIEAAARDYLAFHRVARYREELLVAARESGVDAYLLAGIVQAESSGRLGAVSPVGAMGLFQLSRTTATWRAEKLGLPRPTDDELLSNPLLNARLGADNVAWLLDTFDGDEVRAMCAYNAGTRRMKELADAEGGWDAWRAKHEAAGDSDILSHAFKILRYRDEFRARGLFEEEDGGDQSAESDR